jgi:predicted dehydrogenase
VAVKKLRVGVVGCGLIGKRRATEAARSPLSQTVAVADSVPEAANELADALRCTSLTDWRRLISDPSLDVVIVATPNGFLAEIAMAALDAGKHVLIEKPMGRNLNEAQTIAAAGLRSGRRIKIGFNHRYHPAIARAHTEFAAGAVGRLISLRVRYGHGGRPGYEHEWRGDPSLSGGGELTDQGVHALDLIHWFAGGPRRVAALTQTAVWPIAPLEDNGYALLQFDGGAVASLHTSWTQWKNLFSLEIFGERGTLAVEGLGGSYGPETFSLHQRAMQGGVPDVRMETFEGPDESWRLEWEEFASAIQTGAAYNGGPSDGIAVMKMLESLYESARTLRFVESTSSPVEPHA